MGSEAGNSGMESNAGGYIGLIINYALSRARPRCSGGSSAAAPPRGNGAEAANGSAELTGQ